jgi:Tfp pilus assembly protein PilE
MWVMWLIPPATFSKQRGSAYLVVMFAVVVMSISITAAAKQWKTVVQREKEADLLSRGIEIQAAIGFYYAEKQGAKTVAATPQNLTTASLQVAGSPGAVSPGWYPLTLEELTKGPKPKLRKVYKDPMTGEDWDYVRAPGGRIKGVRSRSKMVPIKQQEFPQQVYHFAGLKRYHDWVFQYPTTSTPQNSLAPTAKQTQGQGEGTSPSEQTGSTPEPPEPKTPP